MEVDADARAFEALSQHARITDLASIARAVMASAAAAKKPGPHADLAQSLAAQRGLARAEAATSFGNALDVLERGPEGEAEQALARGLAAHAMALPPPEMAAGAEAAKGADDAAAELLWLAAHTPFDALGLVDRALGDRAAEIWDALADRIRRFDRETRPTLDRGEALVAAVALVSSRSASATKNASAL